MDQEDWFLLLLFKKNFINTFCLFNSLIKTFNYYSGIFSLIYNYLPLFKLSNIFTEREGIINLRI